ncbi:hypothetical protein Kisp02_42550 [Kineosporia sp. NBRC 101731]|nr:hypothetical protein Kisp02_42550 [Kineosporia sp. NBRC 101731]
MTVRTESPAESDRLERCCAVADLKLTQIMLARGRTPSQLMVTAAGARSYADERVKARDVVEWLRAQGFEPVRVKIESTTGAPEVPAGPCSDGQYYEHHVKLVLPPDCDLDTLAVRVVPHGAHLSWNARRARADGRHERFVTQRCRGVGPAGAQAALLLLLEALDGLEIVEVEQEFVLYDSYLALDEGWIAQEVRA